MCEIVETGNHRSDVGVTNARRTASSESPPGHERIRDDVDGVVDHDEAAAHRRCEDGAREREDPERHHPPPLHRLRG
jgi:hypothetical protein